MMNECAAGLESRSVLGMRVDNVEFAEAAKRILAWVASAPARPARYVCAANVHMVMQSYDRPSFKGVVNAADLVLPDGVPIVWALRRLGLPQERRVRVTTDLLVELFAGCEARGLRLGLYGGTPETLPVFVAFLRENFPHLQVSYSWSPPFRPLTLEEDLAVTREIRAAGVQLLLVGIGCPKQEQWMAAHAPRSAEPAGRPVSDAASRDLGCVMIGVGAAFDLLGGRTHDAPRWMQDHGLEWLFRLRAEPRRLWRRHLVNDPRFLALFAAQLVWADRVDSG